MKFAEVKARHGEEHRIYMHEKGSLEALVRLLDDTHKDRAYLIGLVERLRSHATVHYNCAKTMHHACDCGLDALLEETK